MGAAWARNENIETLKKSDYLPQQTSDMGIYSDIEIKEAKVAYPDEYDINKQVAHPGMIEEQGRTVIRTGPQNITAGTVVRPSRYR